MGVNCVTVFKAEPVNGEISAIKLGERSKEDESERPVENGTKMVKLDSFTRFLTFLIN